MYCFFMVNSTTGHIAVDSPIPFVLLGSLGEHKSLHKLGKLQAEGCKFYTERRMEGSITIEQNKVEQEGERGEQLDRKNALIFTCQIIYP